MSVKKESLNKPKIRLCTSVFKNGEGVTTKESYTQKWVELISFQEQGKSRKAVKVREK